MTSFQNPIGATLPEAKKQALVELLRSHQGAADRRRCVRRVVLRPTRAGNRPRPSTPRGLVMHCGFFAKSLAPGYRVGWVAAGAMRRRSSA